MNKTVKEHVNHFENDSRMKSSRGKGKNNKRNSDPCLEALPIESKKGRRKSTTGEEQQKNNKPISLQRSNSFSTSDSLDLNSKKRKMGDNENDLNPNAPKKLEMDTGVLDMLTQALKPLATIQESISSCRAGLSSEIQELGRKQDRIKVDLEAQMKTLDSKLSNSLNENKKEVEKMMTDMKGEQQAFNSNIELRFSKIENENMYLRAQIQAASPLTSNLRQELMKKIALAEKQIIFLKYGVGSGEQGLRALINTLSDQEVTVTLKAMGKVGKENVQNWLATFLTSEERNRVLFAKVDLKKKIPKGCTMLRDMPEEYRPTFRDFEKRVQFSAAISQYTSRGYIAFEGVALQLRMSEKGNSHRQLIDSFDPSIIIEKEREKKTTLKMFLPDSKEMRTILMLSISPETTKEALENDVRAVLGSKYSKIESIELNKKNALIVCKERADVMDCKHTLEIEQKGSTTQKVFCNEICDQKQIDAVPMQS